MTGKRNVAFFTDVEPPKGLFEAVLSRIALAYRRAARIRVAALGTVILASVVILIPISQYAFNEFYTSGFYEYASLFSDSIAHGYWQDVLYSLADSIPSLAILLLVSVSIAFIWSLRRVTRDARAAFTPSRLLA